MEENMKDTLKKAIGAVMAVVLLIGVLATSQQTADASGKISTKKYNWDLDADTTVTVGAWFYGFDIGGMDVTLKNYKVTDASKKGYKKIKFTYEAVPDAHTLGMIKKVNGYWDSEKNKVVKGKKYTIEPNPWYAVFDYKNGENLEIKNSHDVTVRVGKWKNDYGKLKKGKGTKYWKKSSVKVEITYPKSYKNMVIAVGGSNSNETNSNKFWKGKCSFLKTEMYKNGTNGKGGSDLAAENISLMRVK